MIQEEMKKLGFGCMRLPVVNGDVEQIDDAQFCKMVDHFMECGFTYFDTAFPYHNEKSEAAVKRCLVDRYPREKFLLADKMPVWFIKTYEDFAKYFQIQLERCGVEYFDFYLLHALGRDKIKAMDEIGGFRFLEEMKAAGKIRHIGFSFHDSAEVLEDVLSRHPEVEFVQLQINYYDWDSENVQSRACYETAVRHHVPVIVMEPVKGGTLANLSERPASILQGLGQDCSFASYAIRYVASLSNVITVLSGMSNYEQLLDNTSYMKDFVPLSEKEQNAIAAVVEEIKQLDTIACTKCRYCVAECPMKISIPELFDAYNTTVKFGVNDVTMRGYHQAVSGEHAKPSACLKCGKCEKQCPQHLQIRELLSMLSDKFEK